MEKGTVIVSYTSFSTSLFYHHRNKKCKYVFLQEWVEHLLKVGYVIPMDSESFHLLNSLYIRYNIEKTSN